MKICMIVPHFLPHIGGGEQLFYDIAKGLIRAGHEVRVVTSNSGGVTGHQYYEDIDTYYCDWRIMFGHPVVKKKDIVEHVKWADIVHTAMFTPATKSRKVAQKYGKPCVITVHEVIGDKWYWFVSNKLKAFAFKTYERFICKQNFTAVHVVSDSTRRDFVKYIGERENLIRVYNSSHMPPATEYEGEPINFREYFNLRPEEKGFLYFGRPAVNKGVFVLEDAIRVLQETNRLPKDVKFCFVLAGQPAPEREKLLGNMKLHGIMDAVIIRDSLKRMELFKVISGADYVIVPSITEGFGFCAVETCTIGRPIIHSDGGSLPEVVFGKTLSYTNRDANDLADKLAKVFEKGETAFTEIPKKQFEDKRMVAEIIDIYSRLFEESR